VQRISWNYTKKLPFNSIKIIIIVDPKKLCDLPTMKSKVVINFFSKLKVAIIKL